jgi:hypothetical protein
MGVSLARVVYGTPGVYVGVCAPGCCAGVWGAARLLLGPAGRVAPRQQAQPGRWAVWGVVVAAGLLLLLPVGRLWPVLLLLLPCRPVVLLLLVPGPVLPPVTGLGLGWDGWGHGQCTVLQQVCDAGCDASLEGSCHLIGGHGSVRSCVLLRLLLLLLLVRVHVVSLQSRGGDGLLTCWTTKWVCILVFGEGQDW